MVLLTVKISTVVNFQEVKMVAIVFAIQHLIFQSSLHMHGRHQSDYEHWVIYLFVTKSTACVGGIAEFTSCKWESWVV
jgi:hypothetical protein